MDDKFSMKPSLLIKVSVYIESPQLFYNLVQGRDGMIHRRITVLQYARYWYRYNFYIDISCITIIECTDFSNMTNILIILKVQYMSDC